MVPRIAAAVEALDRIALDGEAFRHIAEHRDPLSGSGARLLGGRWNPPESFATLYLGLERETVEREFLRLTRRSNRALEDFLPRRIYRYRFALSALLDLRGTEARRSLGLTDAQLAGSDLRPCQAIGEAAHGIGLEGVVAPSAAGAGTVLAVFPDRLTADSYVQDVEYETWRSAPPPSPPSPGP